MSQTERKGASAIVNPSQNKYCRVRKCPEIRLSGSCIKNKSESRKNKINSEILELGGIEQHEAIRILLSKMHRKRENINTLVKEQRHMTI